MIRPLFNPLFAQTCCHRLQLFCTTWHNYSGILHLLHDNFSVGNQFFMNNFLRAQKSCTKQFFRTEKLYRDKYSVIYNFCVFLCIVFKFTSRLFLFAYSLIFHYATISLGFHTGRMIKCWTGSLTCTQNHGFYDEPAVPMTMYPLEPWPLPTKLQTKWS